jgi:putative nucleotidyltransferase with HDIG domain
MSRRSHRQRTRAAPRQDGATRARCFLEEARRHDQAGRLDESDHSYTATIDAADADGDRLVLAEAMRRLAIVRQRQHDPEGARDLCRRSYAVATAVGDAGLAAEAVNSLAIFDLEAGVLDAAHDGFHEALRLGGQTPALRARIEQNLGIVANIRGDFTAALAHYRHSLDAFRTAADDRGCALAYNNLGLVSADRQLWDEAEGYYRECLKAAEAIGDVHLRGLVLMNRTEIFLARRQYEDARTSAEEALGIFDQFGALRHKSETYKILGMVYRDTNRHTLAEARLRAAVELAVEAGAVLEEAEASRELARLYQELGRNQDALKLLNASHRLFKRLDARRDLVDVAGKTAELENTYLAVVRDWGQSIESADSYTHGHCERVATYTVAVAHALELGEDERTTIRLGAYLHDLGKVKTPHEILNKPGRLTDEEFAIMQRHPVDGVEMLAGIEFPWDIKPMIRWHHERYDGTGYPDRLKGDEIPLHAQIICVADVWDALTTTRSYRPAMAREKALAIMGESRHHWRPDVFAAFMESVGA